MLDTASFVTAIRSSAGASGEVLRMVFNGQLVPLMDLNLGLEYRDVVLRAEHLEASGLSAEETLELIEAVEAFAEPVKVHFRIRPLSPDPDDDMVLHLAVSGHADAIVTNNKKHFVITAERFGIPVFTPAEFLAHYRRNGNA